MNIGTRIRNRRNELGWSIRELAERMGYKNHTTVARIEAGKVDVTQKRIKQFSEVLDVSIAYLMDWSEVQEKNDILADIVVKLRYDDEFLSLVETLYKLDKDKRAGVKQMLSAFLK